ncbi:DUF2000 domain-containing protein [Paenibacillus durus]|uniref:DUF2000 domain-containing protein n=2 Tax=Paenibacillus durus TaxID=44251 RepID=A0A0F7F6R2_PAEDU|nr:DUF2000 domain-containing protein [Paenibacillus durus]AKG33423.1 hypothetical protein VK70_01375 [Paenibacillus durus ATCC 35681]
MKVAIVIDKELPIGFAANTAAVLGVSLGNLASEIIGPDVKDADERIHRGITSKSIPILGGTKEQLKIIREKLNGEEFADLIFVDFSQIAQKSLDYATYTHKLQQTPGEDIEYLGCALYGPEKKIKHLTGSIGLLR